MIGLACSIVYANSFLGCINICDDASFFTHKLIGSWVYNLQSLLSFLYSLAYHVSGYNPWSWHLISLILHIVTSMLAFNFLKLFFSNKISLIGAIIFAVHPVHTEAVTWISGRVYILNALFSFAIILLFIDSIKSKFKILPYSLALVMYVFWARETNPFFMSVPLLLIITGLFLGVFKKSLKGSIPFIAITFFGLLLLLPKIPLIFAYRNENGVNLLQALLDVKFYDWFGRFSFSMLGNFRLLFYPVGLTYYHEPALAYPLVTNQMLVAYIFAIFLFPLIFNTKKNFQIVSFSVLLYFILMFPFFSPVALVSSIAERYLYMVSIVVSLLVCLILDNFKDNKILFILSVSLILFFSGLTILRNNDYRSSLIYWEKTVEASPYSYRAHNNLGLEYLYAGYHNAALKEFKESLRCKPHHENAIKNIQLLGLLHGKKVKQIKVNPYDFLYIFGKTNYREMVLDRHLYKKL